MSDPRSLLERESRRFIQQVGAFERLVRRRNRKRRNQRIAAGVVGIAVFVAAVWIVTSGLSFDRTQTPAVPGPTETGPAETGPAYHGPTFTLGPVTPKDIAVGDAFSQAWLEGDGEALAAMFTPEGTFDGFQPAIFPALHDWFRAGGWTFQGWGCAIHGWGPKRGVVGCGFTYENDLTRALGLRPQGSEDPQDPPANGFTLSLSIDAGRIETAWFGGGGDTVDNMFGSPDPGTRLFGDVWNMFIEWISSRYPEDFDRMYDPNYGYPINGYPILDPASIRLWERHTDEFVASPQALTDSFTEWMASQSFEVRARRICLTATDEFWAMKRADNLGGRAFSSALADVSEETLAELRALPLESEYDREKMDAFVPLAQRWIELFRQAAGLDAVPFPKWKDLQISMDTLIDGCLITGLRG
jgi:hypothetical protein